MRPLLATLMLAGACTSAVPMTWDGQSRAFLDKLTEVLDASGGDCARVVAGLKELAPQANALAKTLADSGHKFREYEPDAATKARLERHGDLLDRCEREQTPGFSEAVDSTLLTVQPLELDMKGVDLSGVTAPE